MTSRWVAAARERESRRADRLFDDPLAGALAGDEGRAMMAAMEAVTGAENPYLAIRTRFLDDFLLDATRDGIRQIVILAAGMDARAFRLGWPSETVVFEVERGEVLDYKRAVLAESGVAPRARRVEIRADLREDYRAGLCRAGFSEAQPTAFLLEGLLPYLPNEAAALSILSGVAASAAAGSRLALDTIGQSFLQSPFAKPHLDRLRARGVPWEFGDDDPEGLLTRSGFAEVTVRQPGEVGHGRWPHPTVARSVPGVPRVYLVVARRGDHETGARAPRGAAASRSNPAVDAALKDSASASSQEQRTTCVCTSTTNEHPSRGSAEAPSLCTFLRVTRCRAPPRHPSPRTASPPRSRRQHPVGS